MCQKLTFFKRHVRWRFADRTYAQNKNVGIGKQRAAVQQTPFLMSAIRSLQLSPTPNKPSTGIHGVSG
jgi:hypothetical protein